MTDFENLPSEDTPLNATNLNQLLGYKGILANNTDLNNLTKMGIYYTADSTLINAGTNYNWSYLIVISNGGLIQQYIIKPLQAFMIMREYSGYPAEWKDWKTENDSGWQLVELDALAGHNEDIPLMYRKINNIVYLCGAISYNSTPTWASRIGQLPEGFRPLQEQDFCVRTLNAGSITVIAIMRNGDIDFLYDTNSNPSEGFIISGSFIADN